MLSQDILKRVHQIEITTRKVVDDLMSGSFRSHFKGHGVQFSEHRQYVAGDDVRHIDWKVSARSRDPLIKKYEEERELTVFLIVDVSGSEDFGSTKKLKSEIAAEISGMLAYAAVHTGDRVGALLFGGEVELIIPPKKGKQHVLRIIRDVLSHKSRSKGTNLKGALEAAGRIMKHSGVVFVISDFMATDYDVAFKRLARRHDVVAIRVGDQRELLFPEVGQIYLLDPETGIENLVDTGSYVFKKWFKEYQATHAAQRDKIFKESRAELLKVQTQDDYADAVVKFFKTRAKRRR